MSGLARSAIEAGVEHGILVASEDGQRLYMTLGWQPVADVLIATTWQHVPVLNIHVPGVAARRAVK